MLTNREQICFEITMLLCCNKLKNPEMTHDIFKQLAENHSVHVSEIESLFLELEQYLHIIRNETEDKLSMYMTQMKHAKRK